MNQVALEKFIVKEFLGEANYAQTDGKKWWFVVYGLAEASEWQASVDNHPAFKVTDTRSVPDEGFVIEFCFTQPPRITYGAEPDAEMVRLRSAGKDLVRHVIVYEEMYDCWRCEKCGSRSGVLHDQLKHAPDCLTRVFTEKSE